MDTTTFEAVPTSKLPEIEKKLKNLKKKATKLGILFDYEIGEPYGKNVKDQNGRKFVIEVVPITITGKLPAINGWKIAAKIEHDDEGNIIKQIGSIEVPKKYRKTSAYCDHCKLTRNRKDTFLIRKVGKMDYQQVGKECLKDFTGHKNPAAVADVADGIILIKDLLETESNLDNEKGINRAYDLESYLTYVAAAIRLGGFISKSKAEEERLSSTADIASSMIIKDTLQSTYTPIESDAKLAAKTIEWAKSISENVNSTYMWNLHIIAEKGYAKNKDVYMAASMIPAYNKEMGKNISAKNSKHIGDLGEKVVTTVTVKAIKTFRNEFRGGSPVTYMYDFVDDNGNMVLWYSSKEIPQLQIGTTHTLLCNVKEHGQYKSVAQTKVNRCKIVDKNTKAPSKKQKKSSSQKYEFSIHWLGDTNIEELKKKEEEIERIYNSKSPTQQALFDKVEKLRKNSHTHWITLDKNLSWSDRNQIQIQYDLDIGLTEAKKQLESLEKHLEESKKSIQCKKYFLNQIVEKMNPTRKVYGRTWEDTSTKLKNIEDVWIPNMPFGKASVGILEVNFTAGKKRYPITLWIQFVTHNDGLEFMIMSPKKRITLLQRYNILCYVASFSTFGKMKIEKTKFNNAKEFSELVFQSFFDVYIDKIKKDFGSMITSWGDNAKTNIDLVSTLETSETI